jgi:hypothetical protein
MSGKGVALVPRTGAIIDICSPGAGFSWSLVMRSANLQGS